MPLSVGHSVFNTSNNYLMYSASLDLHVQTSFNALSSYHLTIMAGTCDDDNTWSIIVIIFFQISPFDWSHSCFDIVCFYNPFPIVLLQGLIQDGQSECGWW